MSDDPKKPEKTVTPFDAAKLSALAAANIKPVSNVRDLQAPLFHQLKLADTFKHFESYAAVLSSQFRSADLARAIELTTSPGRLFDFDSVALKAAELQSPAFKALQSQSAQWRRVMESFEASALSLKPQVSLAEVASRSALAWSTGLSESMRRISELGEYLDSAASREPSYRPVACACEVFRRDPFSSQRGSRA